MRIRFGIFALTVIIALGSPAVPAGADETCNSPYHHAAHQGAGGLCPRLDARRRGLGDGSDKLVTIGANPRSKDYGKVVHTLSVGGRGEAHHMGFTDDRKYLWAGGLDD